MTPAPQPGLSWRQRAHLVIDRGAGDDLSAKLVHGGLVALIVINIAALVLESGSRRRPPEALPTALRGPLLPE